MRAGRVTMHLPRRPVMQLLGPCHSSHAWTGYELVPQKSMRAGEMKSGQLPAGGWPGARAGCWLAARRARASSQSHIYA